MGTTVRRGPRYRTPTARPSGSLRENPQAVIQRATGLTPDMAKALRYKWPSLIACAVLALREAGYTEVVAQMTGPIDAAMASRLSTALADAICREQHAESVCDEAQAAYLTSPSPETRRAFQRAQAVEMSAEAELLAHLDAEDDA